MLTIASLTLREMLRKRILLIIAVLTVAFLVLYSLALRLAARDLVRLDNPLVRFAISSQMLSAGLYLSSFIVAFLAIFSAVGAVSGEAENGTLHAIVPKPLPRRDIVLGKYLGYGAVLAIYAALLFAAVVAAARYFLATPTRSEFPALALFVLEPLLLLALTLYGTTVMSTLANGVTLGTLFVVGLIGGMVEQVGTLVQSQSLVNIGIVTSLIMPADAIYRKAAVVLFGDSPLSAFKIGPYSPGSTPSVWMVAYAVLYLLAALGLAVRAFDRRDI